MSTTSVAWVPHILVVDDNHDCADALARLLEAWGFQPLVAYDGPTAVDTALTQAPDAILLDIVLPGMDGYAVARHLRSHPEMEKTQLVSMTAFVREADPQRSLAAGFDHHLLKPIDQNELRRLLVAAMI
jgi:CheY-like chemotaxis protein